MLVIGGHHRHYRTVIGIHYNPTVKYWEVDLRDPHGDDEYVWTSGDPTDGLVTVPGPPSAVPGFPNKEVVYVIG